MSPANYPVDAPLFPLVLAGLFLFGVGYGALVYALGERKTGYVSIFVVLGVGVTLGAGALIDPGAANLYLWFFGAAGAPMIIWDIAQHMRAKDMSIKAHQARVNEIAREMDRDDTP